MSMSLMCVCVPPPLSPPPHAKPQSYTQWTRSFRIVYVLTQSAAVYCHRDIPSAFMWHDVGAWANATYRRRPHRTCKRIAFLVVVCSFFLLLFRFQCCGASCQSHLEHGECHRRRARAQSGEYCLRWMTGHLLYGIGGAKNSQASAWLCVLMNGPHRLYRWYWLLCVGLCLLLSNFIAHRQLKITVIDNYRHLFLFCGCLSDWEKCAVTER